MHPQLADGGMSDDQNPYAAPQTALTWLKCPTNSENQGASFSWALVQQGLRTGVIAGLCASLAMVLVLLLRFDNEHPAKILQLLVICFWFMLATSASGT